MSDVDNALMHHIIAEEDETLTFLCELGPAEYAMTGADGYELSDRWAEAQQMKDGVKNLWGNI